MALTQAQRNAIKANLNLDTLDTYASNPDSLIEQMTPEQLLEGLKCGPLSLEQLNYLFFLGFTATEKALAESKAYTDGKTTELANKLNFCNALSPRSGNLLQIDQQADGSCKFYYGIEAAADTANLHVSNSGNDANAGTKASPLKTKAEAFRRNKPGTAFTVHLDESHPHYWGSNEATELLSYNQSVSFIPYGDIFESAKAQNPASTIQYIRSEQLQRPQIILQSGKSFNNGGAQNEYPTLITPTQSLQKPIIFYGFTIDTTEVANLPISTLRKGFFGSAGIGGQYQFSGCIFALGNSFDLIQFGANGKVLFDACKLNKTSGTKLLVLDSGSQTTLDISGAGRVAGTPIPNSTLTYMGTSPSTEFGECLTNVTGIQTANLFCTDNIGL